LATNATGEAESGPLRLQFDRSVKLAFRSSSISSDGGSLLHRELDDALGLTGAAAELIADPRTGRNGRHRLAGHRRASHWIWTVPIHTGYIFVSTVVSVEKFNL
jgi:hypothetical protein